MAARTLCAAALVWLAATAAAAAPQDIPQITASQHLTWDQPDTSPAELEQIRFFVYVDGARGELPDASCQPAVSGFTCSASVPSMSLGQHALQVSAYSLAKVAESAPTDSMLVDVVANNGADALSMSRNSSATTGPVSIHLEQVTSAVGDVTGLAVIDDGSLLIGERSGAMTFLTRQRTTRDAALDDASVEAGGLVAVAPDPAFASSRFVFVAYAARGRNGTNVFRVARLREAGGTFADRVVLFEERLTKRVRSAALKFAADGTLYVAWQNKFVRLNVDGTTPADQDARVIELDADVVAIAGFDWQPQSGSLWLAVGSSDGVSRLTAFTKRSLLNSIPATPVAARDLPTGCTASAMTFYRGSVPTAFTDNLFVACDSAQVLIRLGAAGSDALDVIGIESLLGSQLGRVGAIAIAPDGSIYLGTTGSVARLVVADR